MLPTHPTLGQGISVNQVLVLMHPMLGASPVCYYPQTLVASAVSHIVIHCPQCPCLMKPLENISVDCWEVFTACFLLVEIWRPKVLFKSSTSLFLFIQTGSFFRTLWIIYIFEASQFYLSKPHLGLLFRPASLCYQILWAHQASLRLQVYAF